jgi:uncharacterized RDD family membrane protein YckC/predicted RNA-binding Zn-ribbon protein involved in translation (DUF1610 family)
VKRYVRGKFMPYCKKCGNLLTPQDRFCPKCGTAVFFESDVPRQAAPIASQLSLASWGERFVAWLIDVIIIGVLVGLLEFFTWFAWEPFEFLPSWLPFVNFGTGGVLYFLYWTLMEGLSGQSFGKMLMRLRVVRLDGSRIDLVHAALESVGKAFFLLLDLLIGWALYPKRRQRIFNFLSETVVVREGR